MGKLGKLDAGNNGNGGLSSLKHLPRNALKRLRRHGKRLGKRRLRDFQPLKYAGTVPQAITTECSETPSAARKTAGKRRLRDFQPLNHIEHGLLPAERPKVSFVAAFSVPRMRASVSSVVLYFGMLKSGVALSPSSFRKLRTVWLSLPLRRILVASHFTIRPAPT